MPEKPVHRRIVEVEITETITRIAHLELVSDEPIDDTRLNDEDVANEIKEVSVDLSSEKDSGIDTVEVRLVDPDQEHRYRRSLDGEVDLDEL